MRRNDIMRRNWRGLQAVADYEAYQRRWPFYDAAVIFRGQVLPRHLFDLLWDLPPFVQADLLDDPAWTVHYGTDGFAVERAGVRFRYVITRWTVDFEPGGNPTHWASAGKSRQFPPSWTKVQDWFRERYPVSPAWLQTKVLTEAQEFYVGAGRPV